MRVPIDESVDEHAPVTETGRGPAASWSLGLAPILRRLMRNRLAVVSAYIAAYVVLDRLSTVHVLPHVGFTLWNPPPACSLALLLSLGLRAWPAVYLAELLADWLSGEPIGVLPTLTADLIIAGGYTGLAALLRQFAGPRSGFADLRATVAFLGIVFAGVLAIGTAVSFALALLHVVMPDELLSAIRHFWVGDVTGIVGLLPALMTAPSALLRWQELPNATKAVDGASFLIAVAGALWLIFEIAASVEFRYFYLLLLPVIWIGARHGLALCAFAVLIEQITLVSVVVLYGLPRADFIDLQLLSLTIAGTGLILGTVVTERQRAELHLRRQQAELGRVARLTTAGALGSAIVHEIAQPLATIVTYAHAWRNIFASDPTATEVLSGTIGKIETEAVRAGEIVRKLRNCLTGGEAQVASVNVTDVTRRVVALLADEAKAYGTEIHVQAVAVPAIGADHLQIEQVLLNLIRNAIEATAEAESSPRQVVIRIRPAGHEVEVAVQDTGPGIQADIADQLFQPLLTTKPDGMGLGLLLSREIARFYGGDLWFDRMQRDGALFIVRLPAEDRGIHNGSWRQA